MGGCVGGLDSGGTPIVGGASPHLGQKVVNDVMVVVDTVEVT